MAETTQIVIPLYPGVTHLDFTGPHQVLCRLPGVQVVVASMGGQDIVADGLTFGALADLAKVERADVLCVPGGLGTTTAMLDEAYMGEVRRLAAGARYLTSVCTGSLILAATGRLRGKRAACHWAWRELLEPFGAIVDEGRVVRDGNVITGGGVTAGIDFALVLAAELAGEETARAIQLTLEYAPAPPFDSGRPETAAPATRKQVSMVFEGLVPQRRAAALEAARRLETA
ncbi:MAG: DJ-1/PfpI family protein [Phenylobacterium sp.]|jgi:putative intracellular protease/amidase|uniref:DJ-1/PfpI family protein n=1 Tax=Phenylobacterium sp. TaxID=1871053 RepID=UPI002A362119|nr:DJ-1/PfpI family protein [Phenylobacterium sp.]MDX9998945.1 DJ-1/PfpI family protein [Phenylobacterium sp.]